MDTSERLDSWKAIADYLGRDRTTVMRWERTAGLPVRRVAGGRGRSVFAYKADIDKWLIGHPAEAAESAASPSEPRFRPSALTLAAGLGALVTLIVAGVAIRGWGAPPKVARTQIAGPEVIAFDGQGRELWRHQWSTTGVVKPVSSVIVDLEDEGAPEVVVAAQIAPRDGNEGEGRLAVLDGQGRVRWERTLDARYRFGDREYGPGWFPDALLIHRSAAGVRLTVAAHHHTWWPDLVATYDREGRLVGQFVNAGWISRLNVTADGRYLLAAGVNNSFGGPALAVLEVANPTGSSPGEGGTLPVCANCPSGEPFRYFVAPWSDLARPAEMPFVGVVQVTADGLIEWRASQQPPDRGRAPEVIVNLSSTFEVVHRTVDDFYVELHTSLERAGRIPPGPPNWRQPAVREWRPGQGWREIR